MRRRAGSRIALVLCVTAEEMMQLAGEFFVPGNIAVTVLGNLNGLKISRDQLVC